MNAYRDWAGTGTAVSAAASVRDADGRIALIKNTWTDGWFIPGGAVEPGETPKEAAKREVSEEVGLDATISEPLVVLDQTFVSESDDTERFSGQYVVYSATATGEIPDAIQLGVENEEILAARWFETLPDELHDGELLRPYL